MPETKKKYPRPIDDFAKLIAIITCAGVVTTYVGLFVFYAITWATSDTPFPVTEITSDLKEFCLLIVGAMVGIAFTSGTTKSQFDHNTIQYGQQPYDAGLGYEESQLCDACPYKTPTPGNI